MERSEFLETQKKILNKLDNLDDYSKLYSLIKENPLFFNIINKYLKSNVNLENYKIAYQPFISNNKCIGCEALSRFSINNTPINPALVFLTSSFFGHEEKLTFLMLKKFSQDLKTFKPNLPKKFMLSINVNPKIFNTNFCYKLLNFLKQEQIDPNIIGVELLETSSFDNIDIDDILLLKEYGIKILLDDYSTGYANLENFNKFPFDILKLDGNLIKDISNNPKNQKTVKDIVSICKDKNVKTIAEKVSNSNDKNLCDNLGVDIIQGYYYSRPLSPQDFINFYSSFNSYTY